MKAEEQEDSGDSEDDTFYDRTAVKSSKTGQPAKPGASKPSKGAAQPVEDAASLYGKKVTCAFPILEPNRALLDDLSALAMWKGVCHLGTVSSTPAGVRGPGAAMTDVLDFTAAS